MDLRIKISYSVFQEANLSWTRTELEGFQESSWINFESSNQADHKFFIVDIEEHKIHLGAIVDSFGIQNRSSHYPFKYFLHEAKIYALFTMNS